MKKTERKTAMLITPTLEEVKLAAAKIGLPENEAQKFYYHYESNGWKVGRVRMVSMNGALAGWKIRSQEYNGNGNGTTKSDRSDFWRDSKRLELVEKSIKAIEDRASHTALAMHIQPGDQQRYLELKSERRSLKEKMRL